jgi:hypothetical protein
LEYQDSRLQSLSLRKPEFRMQPSLSRRDFLKITALSLGSLGLKPWQRLFTLSNFPAYERLGRVTVGKIDLKSRPDESSETIGVLYEDAIVPWLRETVGPRPYRNNQRWVETPDGYLWSPQVQPVWNRPNIPLDTLPQTSLGLGMWVEVGLPYVDLFLDNPPARAVWLRNRLAIGLPPRLFYSQIAWVDQIKTDGDSQVWYRVKERYGDMAMLSGL